jgi:hypothetical protein
MDLSSIGKIVLYVGAGLVVLGGLLLLLGKGNLPLGRLPGDIRIETESITCIFPLVTSLLVSALLTVILNLLLRLFKK